MPIMGGGLGKLIIKAGMYVARGKEVFVLCGHKNIYFCWTKADQVGYNSSGVFGTPDFPFGVRFISASRPFSWSLSASFLIVYTNLDTLTSIGV